MLKLSGDNAPFMGMISESRDAVRQCPSVKNHLIKYRATIGISGWISLRKNKGMDFKTSPNIS
jgi:hypothetical protein